MTTAHPPCRLCGTTLEQTFVDLGASPLCESFLTAEGLDEPEVFYPLHVRVCGHCFLVQLPTLVPPEEIFGGDYAYFSSFSDSWLEHAARYTATAAERLGLGEESFVVEVASNDGYLLQYFRDRGVPVLGIEPAVNVSEAAVGRGIPTRNIFLGAETATTFVAEERPADLVVANNVLAHVPDLHDFVEGLSRLLAPTGVLTLEFPHLQRLIEGSQLDTIYHEHYSYLSLHSATRALGEHGLAVFDVEELSTHGGSLRVWAAPADADREPSAAARAVAERERRDGITTPGYYEGFAERARAIKLELVSHLVEARRSGQAVAGYGAPGKGNTLLNYCGIGPDLLAYTVDRNPYKHGRFLPGTRIPIHPPEHLVETMPDEILILPWNLREEISAQLRYTKDWGAKLFVPIPALEELP